MSSESAPTGVSPEGNGSGILYAVLITFRRPEHLSRLVDSVLAQTGTRPRMLLLIDNYPLPENEIQAERLQHSGIDARYHAMAENVGPAGAAEFAMREIVALADDRDWLVILNDDMPLSSCLALDELMRFATAMAEVDPCVGGVGRVGHRFNWRSGRLVRPPDEELRGVLPVDYLATGFTPLFRLKAIRDVGPIRGELFIGMTEVEFGLRLKRAGWSLYASAHLWKPALGSAARRARQGRMSGSRESAWRRYYSLRNLVYILRSGGYPGTALWVAATRGLAKPLVRYGLRPHTAVSEFANGWRAINDGWKGQLGRRFDPELPSLPSGDGV